MVAGEFLYGGVLVGPEFAASAADWLQALQAYRDTVREPELEQWVAERLPVLMAERWRAPYLKRAEILRIADWAVQDPRNRTPRRLEQVDPLVLERSVRTAFLMRAEPAVAVQKLMELRAVGLTLASAILAACFPAQYAIMSEPILCCVPGLAGRRDGEAYAAYVALMRLRAADLSAASPLCWTPRMVDQALYAFSARRQAGAPGILDPVGPEGCAGP